MLRLVNRISILLCTLLIVSACAAPSKKSVTIQSSVGGKDIEIGYNPLIGTQDGYYVVLNKLKDEWEIYTVSKTAIYEKPYKNSEIIFISKDLDYAQIFFGNLSEYQGSTFECTPYFDNEYAYTPCTSELTSSHLGLSIGKNIIAAATTFGLASGYHAKLDYGKIAEALESTDLLTHLELNKNLIDFEHQKNLEEVNQVKLFAQQVEEEREWQRLATRHALLPQVKQIGASVCKEKISGNQKIQYFGYVENIAEGVDSTSGARIQIRVVDAWFIPSKARVGGFQHTIIWEDPLLWSRC